MNKDGKNKLLLALFIILLVSLLYVLAVITASVREKRVQSDALSYISSVRKELGDDELLSLFGYDTAQLNREYSFYEDIDEEESDNLYVYDSCRDGVVKITSLSSTGSGIIISPEGLILTVSHNIRDRNSIDVTFSDGSREKGELIGSDDLSDVALVRVRRSTPNVLVLSSSAPFVGEKVYVIGHPYGNNWSQSYGEISGLDRSAVTENGTVIPSLLQMDMLVYPGNSGGPLLDRKGEVLGLVDSNYSQSQIAFALPSLRLKEIIRSLYENGKVERGEFEARVLPIDEAIASSMNITPSVGLLVSEVKSGGNLDESGIRGGNRRVQYGQSLIYLDGDVILSIDGITTNSMDDYRKALFYHEAGDIVSVMVRRGKDVREYDVTLSSMEGGIWQK